jgi:spore maturation protein CgeB
MINWNKFCLSIQNKTPMEPELKLAFFGSSLVSSYRNETATYYRGILKILHNHGYSITFYEPDILDRQASRDIDEPPYCRVVVYQPEDHALESCLFEALEADIIIKASGVGMFDKQIESFILKERSDQQQVFFWDVDAPATLERLNQDSRDYFLALVPEFDHVLTSGGGKRVQDGYLKFGAKRVTPIYNAYNPETHFPVERISKYEADLAFLGNRLPDIEDRVDEFFFKVAKALPERKFILGGCGWEDKAMPENVTYVGHVFSNDHNAFNCSPLEILNISRSSMAEYGYTPATRIFEATGAGACVITDGWMGVSFFFEPEREILVVGNGDQLINVLSTLDISNARKIGNTAIHKAIENHTYQHRVSELLNIFDKSKKQHLI